MAPSSPQAFMDIIPQRLHATVWAVYTAISSQLGIVCSRQMLDVKTVRLFFRAVFVYVPVSSFGKYAVL